MPCKKFPVIYANLISDREIKYSSICRSRRRNREPEQTFCQI